MIILKKNTFISAHHCGGIGTFTAIGGDGGEMVTACNGAIKKWCSCFGGGVVWSLAEV